MKDTYTSENGRDFRQRYVGCYGRYTTDSGRQLTIFITDLNDYEVRFENAEGVSLSARVNSGVEFEFYPLNRRLSTYGNLLVYSERRAARQWQRGVCAGNTRIVNLSTMRDVEVGHAVVNAIYNVSTNYLDTYTQFLQGARTNFLLSDKFGVVNNRLYIFDKAIGTLSGTTLLVDSLFLQEVKDALVRSTIDTLKVKEIGNN